MAAAGASGLLAPAASRAQAPRNPASLDGLLQPFLASHGLPALFAAVVRSGGLVAAGAIGTRRAGTVAPVTLQDRVHIGSNTKAMTALLAGMLVDDGRIAWDTTIGAAFPEFRAGLDAGLAAVTLEQLLSHVGGIPPDNDRFGDLLTESFAQERLNLDELRHWLAGKWRDQPLLSAPGTRFAYSNMGYLLAGAMLEKAAGRSWEELVATRIFAPLGLGSAGFGPQNSIGRVDAALPHALLPDGSAKAMTGGPGADNPVLLGPAGTVHLHILDFATWAGWHAGAGRRQPALVRPETLRRLHEKVVDMPPRPDAAPGTPSVGGYGRGWGFVRYPFAPDRTLLSHNGSNQMNLANITLDPERDVAIVIATNIGGTRADAALMQVLAALHGRFAAG
jgi:CubicO group peptidase (beta-lactamase class C family)